MKRAILIIGLCLAAALAVWTDAAGQKAKLADRYKKWLDEEVVYIIRPLERDVFLKLQNDRERELFIEAFWKQRDPTPGTPENEFKNEHYRRINYANKYYGRSAPMPGWRTDRGRIYIILGEPNDVQRFTGTQGVYNCEVWFYQDKASVGLPAGFNLLFFQRTGQGDYELYSPSRDGPQALLSAYMGDQTDYMTAYQALQDIEPTLADVSMSLIPGESNSGLGRPSLASDMLIQKVENTPQSQLDDKYAQKFLQYKDVVEVDYTPNYLDSDAMIKLVKDPSGIYFVHYALEPKRLSVNNYQDKYTTTLKLNGTVRTLDGKLVYQFEKPVAVTMDEAQMKLANSQPFDMHDLFPLIPGTYRISILVKNESSKEFCSFEQTIVVPGDSPVLQMTSPILGYKTARADASKKRLKPFQIGSNQIYCQPTRIFTHNDTVAVAFQVMGLTASQRQSGQIRYVFTRNAATFREKSRAIGEYPEVPNFLEEFPLADFIPAHYNLSVSVFADGRELVTGTEEFDVTHQEVVPRPWYYSKLMPEGTDPLYSELIGTQLLNSGRPAEARTYLEKAYKATPQVEGVALTLAQLYMTIGETSSVPGILSPFLNPPNPPKYEVYLLAGQAYEKLGDYAKGLEILDSALSHFGVNVILLNSIGECNARLGRTRDALSAWDKSLQINPDQPDIKKKAEALREKK